MRQSWDEFPLGQAPLQIIDGDRGKAYPKHGEFSDDGYCLFLSATNVTSSGFDFSECQFISEQKDEELRKGRLSRQDVVLTTRGTLGNVALYGDDVPYDHVRINSGMVIMRTNPTKLLPTFLYGFLRSPGFKRQVEQLRSGVAQPQLPIRDINKIKFPLPRKEVQERIVTVLAIYDSLIENNLRRMKLLEESARLLYREWFVRLRFPGHEHTRIVNGMPEGWRKGQVGDLGEIITGKTPSTEDESNYDDDVQFIKTPDMHRQLIIVETEQNLSEKGANSQSNKFIPEGSSLVACIGAKLGVVSLTAERCQTNQQINAVIPHHESMRYYSFLALRDLKPMLQAMGGGATMPNVNKNKFSNLPLLLPPRSLMATFNEVTDPVFSQIRTLLLLNKNLKTARDLLLPKLMSGEIAV